MKDFKQSYGPWAVVTGASSGIGYEFAQQLAALGLNLVLVARREEAMASLADGLKSAYGIDLRVIPLDLTEPLACEQLNEATSDLEIGLLINNAGMGAKGPVIDTPLNHHRRLLYLNCRAPLELAHFYGNRMKANGKGGIIFTSSVSAFAGSPYIGHYAASKAYELYIAEAMQFEMRHHNVDIQALCPGFTRTEMTTKVKGKKMEPSDVVGESLRKLGKKIIVIPGTPYKLSHLFVWLFISRKQISKMIGKSLERGKIGK